MNVYVLAVNVPYEGRTIAGVFSSPDKAKAWAAANPLDDDSLDYILSTEPLDEPGREWFEDPFGEFLDDETRA